MSQAEQKRVWSRRSYYMRRARQLGLPVPQFDETGRPTTPLGNAAVPQKKTTVAKKSSAAAVTVPEMVRKARQLLSEIEKLSAELVGLFHNAKA